MIAIFLLIIALSSACMAAPRYGDDGGYQGYASYKPFSSINALLAGSEPKQKGVGVSSDNSNYGLRKKEIFGSLPKELSPISSEYSVPKSYEALKQIKKYSSSHGTNQLLGSSASPAGQSTQYGSGGYKIADVYSNEYSGNSYEEKDEYANHEPQPYEYGYQVKDIHGNKQFKTEISDGKGGVKGSYGFTDEHGLYRKVEYVADEGGFRANIKTNEPGTGNQDPADVYIASPEGKH